MSARLQVAALALFLTLAPLANAGAIQAFVRGCFHALQVSFIGTDNLALRHILYAGKPRFKDAEYISKGAFGKVYKATDRSTGEVVAVKLLSAEHGPEYPIAALEGARYAQQVARIQGAKSQLVAVKEVDPRNQIIIMEYLRGENISPLLDRALKTWANDYGTVSNALGHVEQMLGAAVTLQEANMMHSDIKADNFVYDYSTHSVKLVDPDAVLPVVPETQLSAQNPTFWNIQAPEIILNDGEFHFKNFGAPFMALTFNRLIQEKIYNPLKNNACALSPDQQSALLSRIRKELIEPTQNENPLERISLKELQRRVNIIIKDLGVKPGRATPPSTPD